LNLTKITLKAFGLKRRLAYEAGVLLARETGVLLARETGVLLARETGVLLARDSGRKHKAWGASPRIKLRNNRGARDSGRQREMLQAFARCRGLRSLLIGAFNLGLAPQALCLRLLRRLKAFATRTST
jgi:hypothetical protein